MNRCIAAAVIGLIPFGCGTYRSAETCSGTEVLIQGYSPPLVAAAANGDLQSVKTLLAFGANPNGQDCDDMSDARGVNRKQLGFTPLMLAVAHGHLSVAQLLIRAGAEPNRATSDGRTAMDFAIESGRVEAVDFMRKVGGKKGAV